MTLKANNDNHIYLMHDVKLAHHIPLLCHCDSIEEVRITAPRPKIRRF